jgi:hypothetical protein
MAGNHEIKGLDLTINGIPLRRGDSEIIKEKCKFLIKPTTGSRTDETRDGDAKLSDNLDNKLTDRFKVGFLKHIATLQTSAAADASWTDATNEEMVTFLKNPLVSPPSPPSPASGLTADNIRNFVVSVQVVLINADKTVKDAGVNYDANDVAIIQFPLYRSHPAPGEQFGGRRRTKAFKGKSSYRTRKHKNQVGTK